MSKAKKAEKSAEIVDIVAQLAELETMKIGELQTKYQELFGEDYVEKLPSRYWISPGGRALGVGAQFLAGVLLVAMDRPLAAGCLVLLVVPQMALLPWLQRGQPASWYVRHTRAWLVLAIGVAAWAL